MSAKAEYEKLRKEVEYHNRRYYVLDNPEISDPQYDAIYRKLQEMEREHPEWVTPDSPTQRVGGKALEKFEKAEHRVPLLSLEKAYDDAEVRAWVDQMEREIGRKECWSFTVEPKIDGDSLSLVYEKGALVRAATRGDGRVGENVTHAVRTIQSVPLSLPEAPDHLEILGEAYIRIADFKKINAMQLEKGLPPYANPRNLTSGSIKQLDPAVTASRPLRFLAHGIGMVEGRGFRLHSEAMAWLEGLRVPAVKLEVCPSLDAVRASWDRMLEARERMDLEIDGIVVKVDSHALRRELGSRPKSPRWAIAWKFPAREETTEVVDIEWNVGRSSKITPVAKLRPVPIGGVTVSNASLHNVAQIERLDVRIGDTVLVTRSGDVIPYVVKVIEGKRPSGATKAAIPTRCPSCEARTERTETDVICPNRFGCPAQLKSAIEYFCSRGAMDIEGIGPEWIEQFVDKGFIKSVADLYALTKDHLFTLDRMGEKLAQNMLEAISRSKKTTLPRFLAALGIRQVGERTAEALVHHLGSLEKIRSASEQELQETPDVGPTVAREIHEFFREPRNATVINELLAAGIEFRRPERRGDVLAGQVVVFTGGLDRMTRDEAKRLVQQQGGRTADSVSKIVTLVVAGPGAGSKLEKATKLGIKVLDEGAFLKMIGR